MAEVSIYERKGHFWVAPMDGGVVVAPVFAARAQASELSKALKHALAAVPAEPTKWTTLRDYKSPVRLAAKVKSEREFERGLRLCMLSAGDEKHEITRWLPDPDEKQGFVPDPDWRVELPLGTPLIEVAEVLLKAFSDSSWQVR